MDICLLIYVCIIYMSANICLLYNGYVFANKCQSYGFMSANICLYNGYMSAYKCLYNG